MSRSVFAPEDTRDPAEITDKPDAGSAPACLVETLATYCQYRQIGISMAYANNIPRWLVSSGKLTLDISPMTDRES